MNKQLREGLLKSSECREALNLEAAKDEPNSEKLEKLRKEFTNSEKELRTALAADSDDASDEKLPDAETRERLELRSKCKLGNYLSAAIEKRPVEGAEREFASACKATAEGIPMELFEEGRETRAVTPTPSDDTHPVTRPTIPFLFERTAAASLGVMFPGVGPGQQNIPVLTTAPPADPKAKGVRRRIDGGSFSPRYSDTKENRRTIRSA